MSVSVPINHASLLSGVVAPSLRLRNHSLTIRSLLTNAGAESKPMAMLGHRFVLTRWEASRWIICKRCLSGPGGYDGRASVEARRRECVFEKTRARTRRMRRQA